MVGGGEVKAHLQRFGGLLVFSEFLAMVRCAGMHPVLNRLQTLHDVPGRCSLFQATRVKAGGLPRGWRQ